jgi:hypothetical protein
MRRFLGIIILIAVVVLAAIGYYMFYRAFGDGVQSGELNYVVKKGYLFKTYEGKLIQSGIRSRTPGSIQSYEFQFSVENENIAQKLMLSSGKEVKLHYKEYLRSLPWRGYTNYIVDSIIEIRDISR